MQLVLTPELVLEAYRHGMFPMAYSANSPYIHWVCPERRGQLSITEIHIPRSLVRTAKRVPFEIRINTAFEEVIQLCAQKHEKRPETWINKPIIKTFCTLHEQGYAHSLEAWKDGVLVGGIYGLGLGGAFFGESMFSRATNASKICLIHLCARLWQGGFSLFDTQFVNDHLKQFGVYEITHKKYKKFLDQALELKADFLLGNKDQDQILRDYLAYRGF